MKLIVQPDAGLAPIITHIKQARKTIDILIFRLDRSLISRALEDAVARGVTVRALIAHKNSGGEKQLRKLELRLLEKGVMVSRTSDDLVRYHGKMMIIDGRILHVYGFNFIRADIEDSRSFGVITRNAKLVQEATRLFEADVARQPYTPASDRFVVSPNNARDRLTAFIRGSRRELLIYDPKVSDPAMLRLLEAKAAEGVDIKIIGKVIGGDTKLEGQPVPLPRLHVRAMVRDGRRAFVGSQSLRKPELEKRREIGVIVHDPSAVSQLRTVFHEDWARTERGKKQLRKSKKEKREKKGAREPARALAASA
jgi:phosphatidylserine/phosphatidylglycerophosphate/cardiolipin synthase-like enzyme